jgi:UDP-galactopyranose mutase
MIKLFNEEKAKMDARKKEKLPIKRTFDENDFMAFDTLESFSKKHRWPMIVEKIINNPDFYVALNTLNKKTFNIRSS